MSENQSSALRSTFSVAIIAAIAVLALTLENNVTHAVIVNREDEEKMLLVDQLLARGDYNNRLLRDTIKVSPDQTLGTSETTTAYRARKDGAPQAALFEAVAPDGYGGKVKLMVAVREDGSLAGVRVLAHNETVGWGDYIEIAKSKWIKAFDGKSLGEHSDEEWQVRKDGGRFDYVTRATVSARAVVGGVHQALKYYATHKEELFSGARIIE
jgi:Na+-translocating ferredoxin:NAD+ oxidoreductase subunit G